MLKAVKGYYCMLYCEVGMLKLYDIPASSNLFCVEGLDHIKGKPNVIFECVSAYVC
jgi:hypothetical protein